MWASLPPSMQERGALRQESAYSSIPQRASGDGRKTRVQAGGRRAVLAPGLIPGRLPDDRVGVQLPPELASPRC